MIKEKKDFRGSRDIICGLPDALICHILTFLPTKEAASTSTLAKRWKPLLAFVPNLDLDNSIYFHPREGTKNTKSFMAFVDSVIALQENTPLKKFHLKCKYVVDEYRVLGWIEKVLKRGVSDFDLYIPPSWGCMDESFYVLPEEIFVSKTLVRLKICFGDGFGISVKGVVSLPKLKTLHLDYFKIETSMFNKLLSGCHALEELVLFDLRWDDSRVDLMSLEPCCVTVSIPTLKRVRFRRSKIYDGANDSVSWSFDNPNLVYLEYSDTIADKYQQVSFNSLVEASLQLRMTSDQIYEPLYSAESFLKVKDKINVTNLLTGICNVKILYMSDDTLEVLGCCRDTIPVFDNLIELTIKTAPDVGWKPLPALLKNCPRLETLVFEGLHHKVTKKCDEEDGCFCSRYRSGCGVKVVARSCLSSSPVKVLKILKFGEICDEDDGEDDEYFYDDYEDSGSCDEIVDGIEEQIELVKHFLETMPNLEQVILYYDGANDENVMEVYEQLHKLPRIASANCIIQLISDNLS